MRPLQVVAAIAGFSSLSSAWPWPNVFEGGAEKAVQGIEGVERLFRRQNDAAATQSTTSRTTTRTGTKTTAKGTDSQTGTKATAKGTGSQKATGTITGSAQGTSNGTAAATTQYDERLPAGGVSMQTPNIMSGAQYYRVGDYVTFGWNFTSVLAKPTAINVIASCSANSAEYTIAANLTYDDQMKIVWDTNKYAATATAQQLLTNTYTLVIENSDEKIATGIAQAGYLGLVNQFTFGMYTPQPYTPWAEFNCPTCSAGISSMEKQTLGFLFAMTSITIMSFTYFATGRFGVF